MQYSIIDQIIKLYKFVTFTVLKEKYGKKVSHFYSLLQCIVSAAALPQLEFVKLLNLSVFYILDVSFTQLFL